MTEDGRLDDEAIMAVLKEDFPDYGLRFMTERRGAKTVNRVSILGALPKVSWENDVLAVRALSKADNDLMQNQLYYSLRDEIAKEIARTYGSPSR